MAASFASLSTEVILHILSNLPLPSSGERSPLLATSLVSRQLRTLSQRVLFEEVFLTGDEQLAQLQVWAGAGSRRYTVRLRVSLRWSEVSDEQRRLVRALGVGLAGKGTGRGRQLEGLGLVLSDPVQVNPALFEIPELQGEPT